MLRGLSNFLNVGGTEHHSIDRLKEREAGKGSGLRPSFRGQKRSEFKQTDIGAVSWNAEEEEEEKEEEEEGGTHLKHDFKGDTR